MPFYVGILGGGNDVWGVRIPDLPGCHGGGGSADAAIADAISAASEWADYMVRNSVSINPPRNHHAVVADPKSEFDRANESTVLIPVVIHRGRAVKANISLDAGELEAIDAGARLLGLTRSTFMVEAALDKIRSAT